MALREDLFPPSIEDLDETPELALVAVLDATLAAVWPALIAANPDLHDSSFATAGLYDDGEPMPARVWIADAILTHASLLRTDLERYRHAVEADRERRAREQDDLPF